MDRQLFIEVLYKSSTMSMGEYELYYAYQISSQNRLNLVACSIEAGCFDGGVRV